MFLHPANSCSSFHVTTKRALFSSSNCNNKREAVCLCTGSQTAWVSASEPAILVQVRAVAQSAKGLGGGEYRLECVVINKFTVVKSVDVWV